jgi:competence ComEA-like helix-hairpin-helix protein
MPIRVLLLASFLFAFCNCAANRSGQVFLLHRNRTGVHEEKRLNINTASEGELAGLPFIGPELAAEIVQFRTQHGPFRRVEHLMLIRGISEKRFRKITALVRAD